MIVKGSRGGKDVAPFVDLGLFVTWAQVPLDQRDGIELFLAQKLSPIVGALPCHKRYSG